jgi:O-antigen/teichoic acid export membrane protein
VYLGGTLTLQLIALFYVFLAIQTVLLVLMQALGKTREVILVGVIAAATDIGVALLFVPHFGLTGAVSSKVAVSLVGAGVSIYLCRSYLGKLDGWIFYLKGLISSLFPFAVLFLLSTFFSSRLITLVPYAALFVVIYLACVRGFHLVTQEDRAYLAHTLPGRLQRLINFL